MQKIEIQMFYKQRKSMLSVSCYDCNSKIRKIDLLKSIMLKDFLVI